MRPGGGKAKGSAFERDVCTKLSLWVSHKTRKDLFWRSAMSGGRATVRARKGEDVKVQVGDICAVDPLGHEFLSTFYVECKAYANLNLTSFILKRMGVLREFWDKATKESKRYGLAPMLICRQNLFPTFVIAPSAFIFQRPEYSVKVCAHLPDLKCVIIVFDDLLKMPVPGRAPRMRRTK